MFHVRFVLFKALVNVASVEAVENKQKGVADETFRSESPAMLMAGALLSLDTLMDYKYAFVAEAAVKVIKKIGWTPRVLFK
jgi:hypothetical protein